MNEAALFIIGLGPGDMALLTPLAASALSQAQCIAGYGPYLEYVPPAFMAGKQVITTGMGQERQRCEAAINMALNGTPTALVCSGDPGIYAMAPLIIELLESRQLLSYLPLTIIPGVPALCAMSARLGAPLGHDFASISLSDLLTPWEKIEKRLTNALAADFVCVLYNPRSRGRKDHLEQAIKIAKKYRMPDCPVALGRNIFRRDEKVELYALANFEPAHADMLSLVIIGNEESRHAGPYMLTPRGYANKKPE